MVSTEVLPCRVAWFKDPTGTMLSVLEVDQLL